MRIGIYDISRWIVAAGAVLVIGSHPALSQRGNKISVGDDPSVKEGSPAVVLIEVADFQCPFCGRGAREVLPQVYERFVRTGKVELIYLDMPLRRHPHAFKAAVAAACAGEQKRFWDMHHLLFENQQALDPTQLPGFAEELGLDVPAFRKCLSSGRHAAAIREDMRTAQALGLTGTPAYLLGRRLPGGEKVQIVEIVKGFRPYKEIEKKLNALISEQ